VILNAIDAESLDVWEYSLFNSGQKYATLLIKEPCPDSEYTECQQYLLLSARLMGNIASFKRDQLSEEVLDLLPYFEHAIPNDSEIWNILQARLAPENSRLTFSHAQIIHGAYCLAICSERNKDTAFYETLSYLKRKIINR
jgi:hypothetical protein